LYFCFSIIRINSFLFCKCWPVCDSMCWQQSVTSKFQEVDKGPSIKWSKLYVKILTTQILSQSSCHLNIPPVLQSSHIHEQDTHTHTHTHIYMCVCIMLG
jgi:hypothetical protein